MSGSDAGLFGSAPLTEKLLVAPDATEKVATALTVGAANGLTVMVMVCAAEKTPALFCALMETVMTVFVVWVPGRVGAVKFTVAAVWVGLTTERLVRAGVPLCVTVNLSGSDCGTFGSVPLTAKLPLAPETTEMGATALTEGADAALTVTVMDALLFGGKAFDAVSVQQIGAAVAGAPMPFFMPPPRRHLGVIAGQKHLRHVQPTPTRRTGVTRPLQQAVRMRILLVRSGIAQHIGKQPHHDRVGHHQRGRLAAAQHVVADRQLLVHHRLAHPLVDALVAPACEHQVASRRSSVGRRT